MWDVNNQEIIFLEYVYIRQGVLSVIARKCKWTWQYIQNVQFCFCLSCVYLFFTFLIINTNISMECSTFHWNISSYISYYFYRDITKLIFFPNLWNPAYHLFTKNIYDSKFKFPIPMISNQNDQQNFLQVIV